MREIKYKIWDKEENRFIDLRDDKFNIRVNWEGKLFLVDTSRTDENGYDYQIDAEFLEYTGLKDKNEKEIYVGYIISSEHRQRINFNYVTEIEEVIFDMDNLRFGTYFNALSKLENIKVIGNIYENPELLEVE